MMFEGKVKQLVVTIPGQRYAMTEWLKFPYQRWTGRERKRRKNEVK